MNDTKPRNRIRKTTAEQRAAADQAAKQLDALGARLMVAYWCIFIALASGVIAGAAFL